MDVLNIRVGLPAPHMKEYSLPPDDPLNELSSEEMFLRTFCYEHNHEVLISIGDKYYKVFLDPDISSLDVNGLSSVISDIGKGKTTRIDFQESVEVSFRFNQCNPSCVTCNVYEGMNTYVGSYRLDKVQTLESFCELRNSLMGMAKTEGYDSVRF
jgi:hypothetical protein